MNTDPANTHSPHLDLDEILAKIDGQAIGDRVREHLATCEYCRAEAKRWSLVAGGVRGLAAAAPESAPPARPRHTGRQALAGPRRRTIAAAGAAAALVLIGGASYGVSAALTGHAPGTPRIGTKATALATVSGCAGLEQANGTLKQVSGTSLALNTASGQRVTVTTTASTKVTVFHAPLSDITDGTSVIVLGHRSDGTIAAANVNVGFPRSARHTLEQARPWTAVQGADVQGTAVQGTVADAGTAGFTVVTSAGSRVPVITTSATKVLILRASLSDLQNGGRTIAVGYVASDGTLSAAVVLQSLGKVFYGKLQVNGCSPASIDDAVTAALVSGS
jgi:hypothetical protein